MTSPDNQLEADARHALIRGLERHRQGDLPAAEADYRQAARSPVPEVRAMAIGNLGYIAQTVGRTGDAMACFRAASSLDPAAPTHRLNLALALAQSGQDHTAHMVLQHGLAVQPADEPAMMELAQTAARLGAHRQAVDWYDRALALDGPARDIARTNIAFSRLRGADYMVVLRWIHEILNPACYVEIGVRFGDSLALAAGARAAIGIDPAPAIRVALPPAATLRMTTSDAFFAAPDLPGAIDFGFIDGLHTYDQALRDFLNMERHAAKDAVIALHDCWPPDRVSTAPEYTTGLAPGDCWKVAALLSHARPDLSLTIVRAPPTGLALVTHLNPSASPPPPSIVDRFRQADYDAYFRRHDCAFPSIDGNRAAVAAFVAGRCA